MKFSDVKEVFSNPKVREYVAAIADNCLAMPKSDQHALRVGLRYKTVMERFLLGDDETPKKDLYFAISEIEALEKKEGSPPPKALAWKIDEAIGRYQEAFDDDSELGDRYFALLSRINHHEFKSPDSSYLDAIRACKTFEDITKVLRSPDILTHLGESEFLETLTVASGISTGTDRPIPKELIDRVSKLSIGFVRVGGDNIAGPEPIMSLCDFYQKGSDRRALRELIMLSALPSPFVHFATQALAATLQRTDYALHEMKPGKLGLFLHSQVYDAEFRDPNLAEDTVRVVLQNLNRLDPRKFPKTLLKNFE